MTEYLAYKRLNGKWTWVCKMSGTKCNIVPQVTPDKLYEMGWEGCVCACDKPINKALEDRYERMTSRDDTPDFY